MDREQLAVRPALMENLIFASFATPDDAAKAVGALLDHGVDAEDVSIFTKGVPGRPESAEDVRTQAEDGFTVTTPGDAVEGAKKGAGIGLGVGAIAALAAVTVPGLGIVLGSGALAMALASVVATGAAGALAGGVTGYLIDQGVDDDSARRYATEVEQGGALVCVDTPSGTADLTEIVETLVKYGAQAEGIKMLAPHGGLYPDSESHTAVYKRV